MVAALSLCENNRCVLMDILKIQPMIIYLDTISVTIDSPLEIKIDQHLSSWLTAFEKCSIHRHLIEQVIRMKTIITVKHVWPGLEISEMYYRAIIQYDHVER